MFEFLKSQWKFLLICGFILVFFFTNLVVISYQTKWTTEQTIEILEQYNPESE
jgi:hypothetical protein